MPHRHNSRSTAEACEKVKYNKKEYINEVFSYDGSIEDLLSLCYYYKGDKRLALYYVREAIKLRPNDKRLADNEKFFK